LQFDWNGRFGKVKPILQLKKSINLGDVPHNFHILANKLLELEGTFTDGFANNITFLLDQNNWQLKNCVDGKPQVVLRKHINPYAFDLHCFPIIRGEPQAVVKAFHPDSGFKQYDPAVVGPIVSLPKLGEFISMTIRCGDEADVELLKYAHMLMQQLTEFLTKSVNVIQNDGQSIQQVFEYFQQQLKDVGTLNTN
jgi:hypothetical protein